MTVTSAPTPAAVAAISSPMKPAPMTTILPPGLSRSRMRGRVGDGPQVEDAGQFDARRLEPAPSRSGRQDEMPVADRLSVARLDALSRPVDPLRANAEPQIDALVAEIGLGPQRQAVDVHLALEKRLRQRRPLIGQILLVGEQDDFAVEAVLAQAGGGLDAGVAGAGDDDRGRRHHSVHVFEGIAGGHSPA